MMTLCNFNFIFLKTCLLNNNVPESMNDASVHLHSCIQITALCCFTVVFKAAFGQNLKSVGGGFFGVFLALLCPSLQPLEENTNQKPTNQRKKRATEVKLFFLLFGLKMQSLISENA